MHAPEPSRRWFQSQSLNVLLAIAMVAAFGLGGLGIQIYTVRHRQAVREKLVTSAAVVATEAWIPPTLVSLVRPADPNCRVSKFRLLLGDEQIGIIRDVFTTLAGERHLLPHIDS